MEPCIACDLLAGRATLPGGLIHRTTSWVVEHCVGPLGVGTLIVKPIRHVVGVDELTDEEAAELGPLLREASRVVRTLTSAEQVYNCLWSHAGGRPGHFHYVIQPVTASHVGERDAYGPALQMAMFVENQTPDAREVEGFAEQARRTFERPATEPEGAEPPALTWPDYAPSSGPVVLRPFCPDDVAMARDMATDPYAPLIGTLPAYADEAQALDWIERQPERFTSGSGYSFAIADADSGVALGVIGLMLRRHGRASVGYTVAPRARRRGAAGHGLRALCGFAWSLPELFRLEAYIEPWNTASIRTVEFAGFEREGVLRSYMSIGGRRRDMAIYSRLRGNAGA